MIIGMKSSRNRSLLASSSYLLCLFWAVCVCQEILDTPRSQTVPVDTNATFTCRTSGDLVWRVELTEGGSIDVLLPVQIMNLARRGIYITDPVVDEATMEQSSTLIATGTEENDRTVFQCRATTDFLAYIDGNEVELRVFGPPDPPSNLATTVVAHLQLNISWDAASALPEEEITYRVDARNLNTSSVSSSGELENTHYVFSGDTPCEEYQFTVTVSNAAGSSNANISGSLPALPSVSRSMEGLTHDVDLADEVSINIRFPPAGTCSDYPVLSYTVKLWSDGMTTPMDIGPYPPSSSVVEIQVNGVQGDTQYFFRIVATNAVGDSISDITECYTTDVQFAEASFTGDSVNISCTFAQGSDAKGCYVELLYPRNSLNGNVTQMIERENDSLLAEGEIMTPLPSACYSVRVYDWESDGTRGELPVPVMIDSAEMVSDEKCGIEGGSPTTSGVATTDASTDYVLIAGAGGGGVFALTLLILIPVVVIALYRRTRKQDKSRGHPRVYDTQMSETKVPLEMSYPVPVRCDSQATQDSVIPLYDAIENYRAQGESLDGEKLYQTLSRSSLQPSVSPPPQHQHQHHPKPQPVPEDPNYAQLNQVPVYAFLESNEAPNAILPPSDTDSLDKPNPQGQMYCEISDLHVRVRQQDNDAPVDRDYSEIPNSGTMPTSNGRATISTNTRTIASSCGTIRSGFGTEYCELPSAGTTVY